MSEQNAVHLASPDTYIKYAIQMFACHTFLTMSPSSYHHDIFRELLPMTRVRSMQKVKAKGQMSQR